jgi:hypothetical protein
MAEDEGLQRMAEVPSLGRPIKGDGDFVALNKMLRACFVCRLVKTERQVRALASWGSATGATGARPQFVAGRQR